MSDDGNILQTRGAARQNHRRNEQTRKHQKPEQIMPARGHPRTEDATHEQHEHDGQRALPGRLQDGTEDRGENRQLPWGALTLFFLLSFLGQDRFEFGQFRGAQALAPGEMQQQGRRASLEHPGQEGIALPPHARLAADGGPELLGGFTARSARTAPFFSSRVRKVRTVLSFHALPGKRRRRPASRSAALFSTGRLRISHSASEMRGMNDGFMERNITTNVMCLSTTNVV